MHNERGTKPTNGHGRAAAIRSVQDNARLRMSAVWHGERANSVYTPLRCCRPRQRKYVDDVAGDNEAKMRMRFSVADCVWLTLLSRSRSLALLLSIICCFCACDSAVAWCLHYQKMRLSEIFSCATQRKFANFHTAAAATNTSARTTAVSSPNRLRLLGFLLAAFDFHSAAHPLYSLPTTLDSCRLLAFTLLFDVFTRCQKFSAYLWALYAYVIETL